MHSQSLGGLVWTPAACAPACCLRTRLLPAHPPAACAPACCLRTRLLPAHPPAACSLIHPASNAPYATTG
eukprot:366379-Chlamydomonas_euryale.AAC.14